MKDADKYLDRTRHVANSFVVVVTRHRFILLFLILGAAISFALFRTQSYIDIPRNEIRFTEETQRIKYKQINPETLESFSAAQQDKNIEVDSRFNPDRSNPFID